MAPTVDATGAASLDSVPLPEPGFIARLNARIPEWAIAGFITLVSGFLRFWRLSVPHEIIPLDETYYAKDAAAYLKHGVEGGFAVHPPIGKWMIAAGEAIFGNRPFGWRFSAAVVGTLCILLTYLVARRLFHSRFAAVTASIFVATDGLFFVQSRIAMLDIFLAFFILLAFWLVLEDRARTGPDHTGVRWWRIAAGAAIGLAIATKWSAAPLVPIFIELLIVLEVRRLHPPRTWLLRLVSVQALAALILGSVFVFHSTVVKITALVAATALAIIWVIGERYALQQETQVADAAPDGSETPLPSDRPPFPRPATRSVAGILGAFVILPVFVYLFSYTPWFLSTKRYVPPRCNVPAVVNGVSKSFPKKGWSLWWCYQREIWDYHKNLKSTKEDGITPVHPYMSHAWSWPWIGRPAAHYFESTHVKFVELDSEILGVPNPAVWWPAFFVAIPLLLWWSGLNRIVWWIRNLFRSRGKREDEDETAPRAPPVIHEAAVLILAMFAPLYLPWLVQSRPLFMFYMTPAVPFLALAMTFALMRALARWPALTTVVTAYVAVSIMTFAYFYPVLAALPVPHDGTFGWHARMWFQSDCLSKFIKIRCWI
ncbi:MAG: phospholipid carrier-dependent glycosyltransferase [Actinomycetota bacterium]|nr:phospholipid carrier-dependent glycosyltransferase [Actinomycetota bacterium]